MSLIWLKSLSPNTQTQSIIASMVKVDNVDWDVVFAQEVININLPWTNMWTHFIWVVWSNYQNEVICNSFWIFFTIHKKSYIQSIISDSSCLNNTFDWNCQSFEMNLLRIWISGLIRVTINLPRTLRNMSYGLSVVQILDTNWW